MPTKGGGICPQRWRKKKKNKTKKKKQKKRKTIENEEDRRHCALPRRVVCGVVRGRVQTGWYGGRGLRTASVSRLERGGFGEPVDGLAWRVTTPEDREASSAGGQIRSQPPFRYYSLL